MKIFKSIFLGRTGVGKSSLINYFCDEDICDTDPYKACTKQIKEVRVSDDEGNLNILIDAPGLCEADDATDMHYLGMIDQHMKDRLALPKLVFKSDEKRVRTEDLRLLRLLINRYGSRLTRNLTLVLTFAGNLPSDYGLTIVKRVETIAAAIYGLQSNMGYSLFDGFSDVLLIDVRLKRLYPIDFSPNRSISLEAVESSVLDGFGGQLGTHLSLHPEIAEQVIANLKFALSNTCDEYNHRYLLEAVCRYPFHNVYVKNFSETLSNTTSYSTNETSSSLRLRNESSDDDKDYPIFVLKQSDGDCCWFVFAINRKRRICYYLEVSNQGVQAKSSLSIVIGREWWRKVMSLGGNKINASDHIPAVLKRILQEWKQYRLSAQSNEPRGEPFLEFRLKDSDNRHT